MFYVTMADLTGMIPGPFLIQALDDDSDGAADPAAWNSVAKDASDAVDGVLGGRFTVPFSNPLPAVVIAAAKLFAAEQIYARRGKSAQENPFTKQATEMRAKLEEIAKGEQALAPTVNRAKPSATAITETSKTASKQGGISA